MSATSWTTEGVGPLPMVVGSLGAVDPQVRTALCEVAGISTPAVLDVQDVASVFVGDAASTCVTVDPGSVRWALAAIGADRAVLEVGHGTAELRGDDAGLVPIYYTEIDGGVLFASRVDHLARAHPRRLHVDWSAWAGILTASFPVDARTPFEEIRRLQPDRLLRYADGRVQPRSRTWAWTEAAATSEQPSAAEVLDALREAMAPLAGTEVTLPLSGGWDSRLLGALLAEQTGTRVQAVTVDPDMGHRLEQRFAAAVAAHLGFEHRIVPPAFARSFVEDARTVARALDFQTGFHAWGMELRRANPTDRFVVDGLAGGVLLKNTFVTRRFERATDPRGRLDAIWDRLAASVAPGRLLHREAGRAIEAEARATYRRWSAPLEGHPADAKLAVYGTRTLRAIAPATSQLWGSSAPMVAPIVDPDVAALGLRLPSDVRDPSGFFRTLLEVLDPALVALPSLNTSPPPPRTAGRREIAADVHAWYQQQLCDEPIVGMLAPGAVGWIRSGGLWLTGPPRKLAQPVRGLTLLASWLRTYADQLADVEPPWTPARRAERPAPPREADEPLRLRLDPFTETEWEERLAEAVGWLSDDDAIVVQVAWGPEPVEAEVHLASRVLTDLLSAGLQPDRIRLADGRLRLVASRGGAVDIVGPMSQLIQRLEERIDELRRSEVAAAADREELARLRAELQAGREELAQVQRGLDRTSAELQSVRRARRVLLESRWWRLGRLVSMLRRPSSWPSVPSALVEVLRRRPR